MRFLRGVFQWYIRASIHVSLCLLALVWFTLGVFKVQGCGLYCPALFFSSIAGYNAIKYGLRPWRLAPGIPGGARTLIFTSLASTVAAAYYLIRLPAAVWVFFLAALGITGLYALPFTPGGVNLRSHGLLKIILVALVWTMLSVWAPLWGVKGLIPRDIGVESVQRMLWVFLLMLPFEIRDMGSDPPGMRSVPQRFGLRATRRMAWGVAALFALSTFLKDVPAAGEFAAKAVVAVLMGLSVTFAGERQHAYYAAFWVEGIPIVALLLLFLLQG